MFFFLLVVSRSEICCESYEMHGDVYVPCDFCHLVRTFGLVIQ
jgi:hypothetical protein